MVRQQRPLQLPSSDHSNSLRGQVGCLFNINEEHSTHLPDLGLFIREKKGKNNDKKIIHSENNTGNQIKINHSNNLKRKVDFTGVGYSRIHLYLSGADSGLDIEDANTGFDHQQKEFSAHQTLGTSTTTTNEMITE
ncbi:hypothetical protein AVEN_38573-1 [Araneus ventricosus]|uniref:Uncharacterized protein n=1 Tax=Araneus ventricosus TaxID=182803 RepID=A0A4Y2LDW5_ARAVE|nr:hypothetical protein AVEN_38573-1 [Araneus ventricosus]